MYLIYSCVFHNDEYLKLVGLLLKSFKLYGNLIEYEYLIITEDKFKKNIQCLFDDNNINGKIWCIFYNS